MNTSIALAPRKAWWSDPLPFKNSFFKYLNNYLTIAQNLQNAHRKTVDLIEVRPLAIQGGAA